MRPLDLIRKKRDGGELSSDEIGFLVRSYTDDEIPDYQMAAWLMAVLIRGMSGPELGALTGAMLHSGEVLDLSDLPGAKVDKHSTGGVGDKTSLIIAPVVAAAGVIVPMISGRGLGHTGGTLDKLQSIPGFNINLSLIEFRRVLNDTGFACIIVPDLQAIAEWLATDRLHEPIYDSSAGPVTAHDMLWGFGSAIARGEVTMAHRCGFTPTLLLERLQSANFAEIALRRRSNLELAALVLREDSGSSARREALLVSLDL